MRKVDPEKHQERRQQIVDAASDCFVRSGFRGASISDICAAAGISPGHLYHYFDSKEAIIAMMSEVGLRKAAERFDKMAKKPNVVAALLAEFAALQPNRDPARSALRLEVLAEASRNPAIAKILQHRSQRLQQLLSGFLQKGQELGQVDTSLEPEITAAVLLNIAFGMSSLLVSNPDLNRAAAGRVLKLLVSRFLATSAGGNDQGLPGSARTGSAED